MRRRWSQPLAGSLILVCLVGASTESKGASPRICVQPGMNSAGEVALLRDMDTQTAVGTAVINSDVGQFTLPVGASLAPVAGPPHHYRIELAPFEPLDISLRWDAVAGHWMGQCGTRTLALGAPNVVFGLTRKLTLRVQPADFLAFRPADNAAADTAIPGQTLEIGGIMYRVVALPQSGGEVSIPDAGQTRIVFLTAPRYRTRMLVLSKETLRNKDVHVYPETVPMEPAWGPFTYLWFDIALGTILCGGPIAAVLATAPMRRRRRHEGQLVSRIVQTRDHVAAALSLSTLAEQTVTTETGRRYLLQNLLGRGAMGVVYRALPIDTPDELDQVAVKILTSDSASTQQRFLREVRICQTLHHPSIVKVLDHGVWTAGDQTAYFMIMELLSGRTLTTVLKEARGPIPADLVVPWMIEILQGLKCAHAEGIIHRDLKPDNLMLTPTGHIKIMDFGIARDLWEEGLTASQTAIGTPHYMSPEHFNARHVTARSDHYSVGMVAYELLAGRLPFEAGEGTAWTLLHTIMTEEPPDVREYNPIVPEGVARIVLELLSREPAERPADPLERLLALSESRW